MGDIRFELLYSYRLFVVVTINRISPPKNNPKPSSKQIVLVGCPSFVVHANPSKSQPRIIAATDKNIFPFIVKLPASYFKIQGVFKKYISTNRMCVLPISLPQ